MQGDIHDRSFLPIPRSETKKAALDLIDRLGAAGIQFTFSSNHKCGTTSQRFGQLINGLVDSMSDDEIAGVSDVIFGNGNKKTSITPEFLDLFAAMSKQSSSHLQVGNSYTGMIMDRFDVPAILDDDWPMACGSRRMLHYIRFINEYVLRVNSKLFNYRINKNNAEEIYGLADGRLLNSLRSFIDRNFFTIDIVNGVENKGEINEYTLKESLRSFATELIYFFSKQCIDNGMDAKDLDMFELSMLLGKRHSILDSDAVKEAMTRLLKEAGANDAALVQRLVDCTPDDIVLKVFGPNITVGRITDDIRRETLYLYYTEKVSDDRYHCAKAETNRMMFGSKDLLLEVNPKYLKSIGNSDLSKLDSATVIRLAKSGTEFDWKRVFKYIPFSEDQLMDPSISEAVKTGIRAIYAFQPVMVAFSEKYPFDEKQTAQALSSNKTVTDDGLMAKYEDLIDWNEYGKIMSVPKMLDRFYDRFDFDKCPQARKFIYGMKNRDAICYLMLKYGDDKIVNGQAKEAIAGLDSEKKEGS